MPNPPQTPRTRPVEILLVEDSPTDRLVTVSALKNSLIRNTLHTVENGVEAMAFLRNQGVYQDVPRPDLVLLDLNLPKMDGREVLTQIKRDRSLRFIPVIVLTTSQDDEDIVGAYGEHANGYITKPVDFAQFSEALRALKNYWFEVVTLPTSAAVERVSKQPAERDDDRTVRLLLVEDSDSDALLLQAALHRAPAKFVVTRVSRLSEARELLETNTFDIVVTDLGLPDSRGVETYRRIKSVAHNVPVIVLTGDDDETNGLAALHGGAADYLLKGELSDRSLARAVRYAIDRRLIQDQLLRSQRIEAVGQLAGGVAHDFNNLLTIIQGNAALLAGNDDADDREELAAEIHEAAVRGATLTRQLLAFSRKQVLEALAIDLNEVVASSGRMLRRIIGDVKVDIQLADALPPVFADHSMLEQVLMNLAVNARDAMPGGGEFMLRTDLQSLTSEAAHALSPQAYAGDFVCLTVHDNGVGMTPKVLSKIWDPFFTTKDPTKGTGLGLSTVYGIVTQHRGWIEVESAVGVGTTFLIYLPVTEMAVPELAAASSVAEFAHRAGTILIVDDERGIRRSASRILTSKGYEVLEASCGNEALRVWEDRADEIDLVLTDMTMPEGMSGRELGERLRAQAPGLPIVFCSGYSVEFNDGVDPLREGEVFLQKPYSAADLLEIVAMTCAHD